MVFALAFSTLAGSLTGYKGNLEAFVNTTQGIYIPFRSFNYLRYVIHDGGRVNLTDDYLVGLGGTELDFFSGRDPVINENTLDDIKCYAQSNNSDFQRICSIYSHARSYTTSYGFDGEEKPRFPNGKNSKSTFGDIELSRPILNISAFSFQNGTSMRWFFGSTIYTEADLLQNGKCQPNLNYQWGFSFIQLFITIILLLIWSIGIYIMWLRSHSVMKRRGRTDVVGEHKAVLELAHAMQQQNAGLTSPHTKEQKQQRQQEEDEEEIDGASTTSTAADVAVPVTEAALRHRVNKELRGGSIAYTAPLLANGEIADDWTIWAWIKGHKWSIAGMIFCLFLALFCGPYIAPSFVLFSLFPFELAATLYLGSTRASRAVIFFCWFLLCSVVPQIILSVCSAAGY